MRSLLYIFFLLVVTSCCYSGMSERRLDDVQSLMKRNPEKALDELNGIDVSELRDSDAVARWSLLYSEAMAANHIYAPTDTIVNVAIEFYSRHNDIALLNRAKVARQKLSTPGAAPDSLAEARYLQKEREYRIYVERSQREQYVLISVIVLLVALTVIGWLIQNLRLRKAQNDALMAEASGLKLQLKSASDETSRMQQSALQGLLDKRFALIDSLCDTYYQSQGTKNERNLILPLILIACGEEHDRERFCYNKCEASLNGIALIDQQPIGSVISPDAMPSTPNIEFQRAFNFGGDSYTMAWHISDMAQR